jgi:hypothetical protein
MLKNYNCISCNKIARIISQISCKCDECDIVYFGDMSYDGNYCERYVSEQYMIQWNRDEYSAKPITCIYKEKYYDTIKQWHPEDIKVLDGWKLFDIRTEEQLEKLLLLI